MNLPLRRQAAQIGVLRQADEQQPLVVEMLKKTGEGQAGAGKICESVFSPCPPHRGKVQCTLMPRGSWLLKSRKNQ